MEAILLVVHLMLAVALVGTVLLQRSEGGGLGIGGGGGGGGMGGFMSGRATANLLTRATAILAAGFMCTSITLAILASQGRESTSVTDQPIAEQPAQSAPVSSEPAPPEAPRATE